jgi:hypothetical protein
MKPPTPKRKPLKLFELAIIMMNVHLGAKDPEVGFEDADRTLEQLILSLNRIVPVDIALLESGLWSCNLLNERQRFWHPEGKSFDEFLSQLMGSDKFNKYYNLVEFKDG